MILERLRKANLLNCPRWYVSNLQYLTIMGSQAYGTSNDDSDVDYYGFSIPPKEILFPSSCNGYIHGFDKPLDQVKPYVQHHINYDNKEYDISLYQITQYFRLLTDNNPNIISSLFVPFECIIHITQTGQIVRENRKLFLSKECWNRFSQFAYAQLRKMGGQKREGKRKEIKEKYGFDVKFASNLVRLLNEVEQILTSGDLDLRKNNEMIKAIRNGDWTEERVKKYFENKEPILEQYLQKSDLPLVTDKNKIKELLINCLEHHYGNLNTVVQLDFNPKNKLLEIEKLFHEIKSLF